MGDSILETRAPGVGQEQETVPSVAAEERDIAGHLSAERQPEGRGVEVLNLVRIALVGLAGLASWFRVWEPFPRVDVIGLLATLVGGYPIFREAFQDIRSRRMTMELSMTIALGAALAIGEFFTASLIVFFVLIAEVLEGLTVGRGRKAIQQLVDPLAAPGGDSTRRQCSRSRRERDRARRHRCCQTGWAGSGGRHGKAR